MKKSKFPTLGKLVIEFISQKGAYLPEYFQSMNDAVNMLIDKIIASHSLKIRKTDDQYIDTAQQLLTEIFNSPEDYTEKNLSYRVSSFLRERVLLSTNAEGEINAYLRKRAFSLLKENATKERKEYIRLNNKIKKALKEMSDSNEIACSKKVYSLGKANIQYNNDFKTLKITEKFIKSIYNEKTKTQIKILLSENDFSFSLKDISSIFAKLLLYKDSQIKEIDMIQDINIVDTDEAIAVDIGEFIKATSNSSTTGKQKEMAMLAYLYKKDNNYFSKNIFTEEQKMISEETDFIENFLNDKRFVYFNKSKKVGRTTAYNRANEAKAVLKAYLADYTQNERRIFIKKYCNYLEELFKELTGEQK